MSKAESGQLLADSNGASWKLSERVELDPQPLSFSQQRLWFMDQLEGNLTAYNMPYGWKLRGPLDVEALRRALEEVVRRHEPLRTTFALIDEAPVQVIRSSGRFELPLEKLNSLESDQLEAEIALRCRLEADRPFDLTSDLMLRSSLLQISADEHVLLLTMHHIASDGWSVEVLIAELAKLYEAFKTGRPSPLVELPARYVDYVQRQRESLHGVLERRLLDYWREQLRDTPPTLELPSDRVRPERQTYKGARQSLTLSPRLSDAIKQLRQEEGTTVFSTLLAAFQLLLSRLSGQQNVVVGIPVAGRSSIEFKSLIGLFVNILALRLDLSGNPTFRELLVRIRGTTQRAYDHQDLPFERLVELLQPERSLSRTPLVQVLFNKASIDPSAWNVLDLTAEPVVLSHSPSKFDLTIYVSERNHQIDLQLVYNVDLFSRERMACLLDSYQCLLGQLVTAPDAGIDAYSLVSSQAQTLLPDPRIALEAPSQVRVTDQVAALAEAMPDQIAVRHGHSSWTYRELVRAANHFACALQACEIGKGDVVPVCGEPSFGLISSIMGTLQCGAVLVLIDSKLPIGRQQLLVEQSGGRLLAIVGESCCNIESLAADRVVFRVAEASGEVASRRAIDGGKVAPRSRQRLPHDAAYIFFTSGTTGIPKGVIGIHRGLSQFLNWQRATFAVGTEDRVAQLSGLSFEPVMRDVFLPLTSGGTLCLPESREPEAIWRWLEREQVTILHSVPSVISSWLSWCATQETTLFSMRYVFFAGSPLHSDLIRKWRSIFPRSGSLVNLYGTTETPQGRTCYEVPQTDRLIEGIQPIGRPIANTQALILRGNNQLCGIGEVGEIAIRTPFGSLGYLDTVQTRERFIPNPFRDEPNDVLYLTGDLGRYRPDGLLDIHGRRDDQLKISGVRIEPDEIVRLLLACEQVSDCHVGTVSTEQGEPQLIAWVVPAGVRPTTTQLRQYLASFLSGSLIPSRFVWLEKMPLTANGKLDRRLLPAPQRGKIEFASGFQAPQDALELQLTKIWEDVLNYHPIGVDDDFFDFGGHSLLAVTLLGRIEKLTRRKLPISSLFQAPSIRHLANILRGENWQPRWSSLVPVQTRGSRTPLFLVPPLANSGIRFVLLSRHLGDDQPVYAFDLTGDEDQQNLLLDRVEEIAARFVQELLILQPRGPYLLGGRCFGAHVAFEMAQQLYEQGQKVTVLVLDAGAPFNGPTWRTRDWKKRRLALIRRTIYHVQSGTLFSVLRRKARRSVVWFRERRAETYGQAVIQCQKRAVRNYCARLYPGNIAVFLSAQLDHPEVVERWASLVQGRFFQFVIPGTSHRRLLQEPGIRLLAEQIQSFLDDFQSVQIPD